MPGIRLSVFMFTISVNFKNADVGTIIIIIW